MLDEVQLLVARGGPEIVPDHRQRLSLGFAPGVDHEHARLLAKRLVRQHHVVAVTLAAYPQIGVGGFIWKQKNYETPIEICSCARCVVSTGDRSSRAGIVRLLLRDCRPRPRWSIVFHPSRPLSISGSRDIGIPSMGAWAWHDGYWSRSPMPESLL